MTGKEGFIISCLGLLILIPLSYVTICKAAISNLHTLVDHVSSDLLCPKLHPEDLFPQLQYHRNERCFLHDDDDDDNDDDDYEDVSVKWDHATPQVAEVNGTMLEIALNSLGNNENAVVLFYANWCPFSRTFREIFDSVSATFPEIYHMAVEDSAIRPSSLSRHGVYSFPVLFLHNKTTKVRYHGSRTVEAIGAFYKHRTGISSINCKKRNRDKLALAKYLSSKGLVQNKANCPYPWAKSPEKWLHDDMYLMLATVFLLMRVSIHLIPRLLSSIKNCWTWRQKYFYAYKLPFRRALQQNQGVECTGGCEKPSHDLLRKGKRVLSLPGWPSSPLSAMSLEGSTSKYGGAFS